MKHQVAVTLLTTAGLLAPLAHAHDVVLVPEADQLRVRYGHPGDWLSVDPAKLVDLQVWHGDASTDVHPALKRQGLDFVASKSKLGAGNGAWLAAARYDNGLWAELPAVGNAKPQWRNATRLSLPNAKGTSVSMKFAKAYAGTPADTTTFGRTAGHLLELVPQKNPLAVRAGEMLPVLVMFNGKPLANVALEVRNLVDAMPEDQIKRYTTGADGIAQVPLRTKGVSMIGVDFAHANDGTLSDAKALPVDKVTMIATYTVVR